MERPKDLPDSNHFPNAHKSDLEQEYRFLWSQAQIAEDIEKEAILSALMAYQQRDAYTDVAIDSKIPWWAVSTLHHMEASGDLSCGISNGQPWNRVTTIVPKGRGPFRSFQEEALFSLDFYKSVKGWNIDITEKPWDDAGLVFWFFESWNGFARSNESRYLPKNAIPYIYSGTQFYEKGKFSSDGIFDPELKSKQVGCMAFLKTLEKLIKQRLI